MASTHRAQPSPRRRTARASAAPGDADLIALVREGDAAASAELWRRHASAARSLARAWSSLDADDLVSEAFLRTLDAIAKGGGPEGAFRPYLLTAVRNAAATGGRRSGREQPLDVIGEVAADDDGPEELALAALDRDLGVRAFRALPARWQEVLWYTAVEGMTPAEAAPLLGLRPNGVAALGHRAREGLRGAWIQQHVSVTAAEGECRWVLQQAGAHTRGRLARRDRRRADAHLEECPSCRGALAEAARASARLAVALLPLVAGVGGATAYAAAGGAGGAPVAGTTGGAAAGTTGGAAAAAVTTGSASLVATIAAAGVLLVAGIAVAALIPPGPTPGDQGIAAPASPVAPADSGEDAVPPSPPTVASPPTVVSPPTVAVPPAPASTAPVPAPTVVPPPVATTPTPLPMTTPTPPPIGAPPPSGTPVRPPTATSTSALPPAPNPAPSSTTPPLAPAAAPTLTIDEDPANRLFPAARGHAPPGSRVSVEDATTGAVYAAVPASTDGYWGVPALPLPAGETTLVAVGERRSDPWTVRLESPTPLAAPTADGPVTVVVLAGTGLVDVLVDGTVAQRTTSVAPGFVLSLDLAAGEHAIAARYASAEGRSGPETATRVVVR